MYQSTACDQIRWNTVQKKALFFFPIIDGYGFTQGHKREYYPAESWEDLYTIFKKSGGYSSVIAPNGCIGHEEALKETLCHYGVIFKFGDVSFL